MRCGVAVSWSDDEIYVRLKMQVVLAVAQRRSTAVRLEECGDDQNGYQKKNNKKK